MTEVKITFCNRAYADKWFKNQQRQSASHFAILQAILDEIEAKDGGDIVKADICKRNPDIEKKIDELDLEIVPSRGQMLKHNGNGIRHAKYAPSRSVAVVWEKIRGTIFVTFDDHAPIRYHRAISHLRDIKLGKIVFPKRARNTRRFLKKLSRYRQFRYIRDLRGFSSRRRYYE